MNTGDCPQGVSPTRSCMHLSWAATTLEHASPAVHSILWLTRVCDPLPCCRRHGRSPPRKHAQQAQQARSPPPGQQQPPSAAAAGGPAPATGTREPVEAKPARGLRGSDDAERDSYPRGKFPMGRSRSPAGRGYRRGDGRSLSPREVARGGGGRRPPSPPPHRLGRTSSSPHRWAGVQLGSRDELGD